MRCASRCRKASQQDVVVVKWKKWWKWWNPLPGTGQTLEPGFDVMNDQSNTDCCESNRGWSGCHGLQLWLLADCVDVTLFCSVVMQTKQAVHAGLKKHVCLLQTEEKDGKMSLWRCHPGMLRFILFEPVWARGEGTEVQWRWWKTLWANETRTWRVWEPGPEVPQRESIARKPARYIQQRLLLVANSSHSSVLSYEAE